MSKYYKVTDDFRQFCKGLSERRLAAGVSQADVAGAIGTDQATVSRIERVAFGDVLHDSVYGVVSAYANAYSMKTPVLEEGAKAARSPSVRVTRVTRQVSRSTRPVDMKHDATATILRLVADGTIPPEVAGIVIKALAS